MVLNYRQQLWSIADEEMRNKWLVTTTWCKLGKKESHTCTSLFMSSFRCIYSVLCWQENMNTSKPNHEVYILWNISNERLNVPFYKYPNCENKNGIDASVAEMHRSATYRHPLVTEHPFSVFSVYWLLLVLRISLCEIRSSSVCGLYFSTLPRREETFGPWAPRWVITQPIWRTTSGK